MRVFRTFERTENLESLARNVYRSAARWRDRGERGLRHCVGRGDAVGCTKIGQFGGRWAGCIRQ